MAEELKAKDAKLIQYLNEAYGKEKELETALEAHIPMTTRAPYKKRLQQHLRETKNHARQLQQRIKQLGGKAEAVQAPGPELLSEAATAVQSAASKAVAAAKGPLHAIRGTSEPEKMLKNAKTEYFNEFEEIATYKSIETLADTVGDRDTKKLAQAIRREEERMARFLDKLIPQLTKAVAQAEIPAAERNGGRRARRSTSRRSAASRSSSRRSGSSRASSSRSSSSRSRSSAGSSGTRRSGTSSRSGSSSSRSRSGSGRSGSRSRS